MDILFTESCN